MTECSFCKALSIYKFAEERSEEGFSYRHRAALLTVTKHNNSGNEARSVDYIKNGKGCPLNYCPECGKRLKEI